MAADGILRTLSIAWGITMALRDWPGWSIGLCWVAGFLLLGAAVRRTLDRVGGDTRAGGTAGDVPSWLPLIAVLLLGTLLLLTREWRRGRGGGGNRRI